MIKMNQIQMMNQLNLMSFILNTMCKCDKKGHNAFLSHFFCGVGFGLRNTKRRLIPLNGETCRFSMRSGKSLKNPYECEIAE